MYFLFYILIVNLRVTPKAEGNFSLFSPAVNENGRSNIMNFFGDYIIKTFSGDTTYVQLGYEGPQTVSGLALKEPFPSSDFRFDFTFQLTPSTLPGEEMVFWLSPEQITNETLFEKKQVLSGIQIKIDTQQKNPVAKLIFNGHENKLELKNTFYTGHSVLRIENLRDVLKVFLSFKDQEFKELFTVVNSGIGTNYYYGVSSKNTNGHNICRIFAIRANDLINVSGKEEIVRKSNKMVWIIFILAVGAIGYVLFQKQAKPSNRRV